ncbi:hypothetical protein [Flavobacterium sp. NRK1]|uniref:hypothetical protein n=1 Tax=Flavobacterium sp. NRK1 TaxID=2954929 RepID=UPI0020923333|nr:hypothetical protein [Flavobacterium sp. NRK1]MCO6147398.1 hypothetical protein [Flavobacterium sp. NRK1]
MENKDPLHFFKSLVNFNHIEILRSSFYEIMSQHDVISTDTLTDTVIYNVVFFDQEGTAHERDITLTFEKFLTDRLIQEISNYKYTINEIILSIVKNGSSPKEFIQLQYSTLLKLKPKIISLYPEKIIFAKAVALIVNFITDEYSEYFEIKGNTRDKNFPLLSVSEDFSPYSFKWDALNPEDALPAIELLYQLLIEEPALIQSSKEDFIAAFTQRKVIDGIKWIVLGKNKISSKVSLFYFINALMEQGFLESKHTTEINKMIEYVFRDNSGKLFKNIRQSKQSFSEKPSQKERLDDILNSIIL